MFYVISDNCIYVPQWQSALHESLFLKATAFARTGALCRVRVTQPWVWLFCEKSPSIFYKSRKHPSSPDRTDPCSFILHPGPRSKLYSRRRRENSFLQILPRHFVPTPSHHPKPQPNTPTPLPRPNPNPTVVQSPPHHPLLLPRPFSCSAPPHSPAPQCCPLPPSPRKSSTTAASSSAPASAAASARVLATPVPWLDAEAQRGMVAAAPRPVA
jgi:hypothetical protein